MTKNPKHKKGDAYKRGQGGVVRGPGEPTHRVTYDDKDGNPVGEQAFSMIDAVTRKRSAEERGATNVQIEPIRGRR